MAFQTGTQIRPELGNADYSGFARAAEIRGAAMADLGSKIGSVIEDYKKDKEDKIQKDNFAAALMPYATKMTGGDAAEAQKIVNLFANKPENAAVVMQFMQLGQEQERAAQKQQILEGVGAGTYSAQEAFAMGVSPEEIKAYTGVTEGQTAKQFTESVALAAESVNGTYDPAQQGIVVDDRPYFFGGKRLIPLSDPMFEPYFATAKGQTMTGRGYDVLETTNSDQGNQGQGAPNTPVSASESGSSPNLMSGIGDAISSIAQTPGNLNPTNPTISTGVPIEYTEPRLDISEVAGGAVSRMSDFFKRKLKENEAVRQSTYGR